MNRATWTDESLDEYQVRFERRFARIEERFDRLDARFDALELTLNRIAGGLLVAQAGVIAAILVRGG